jgi:hypothetical protein
MAKRKKTNNDLQNTIAHDEAYLMQHYMFNGAQYVSSVFSMAASRFKKSLKIPKVTKKKNKIVDI